MAQFDQLSSFSSRVPLDVDPHAKDLYPGFPNLSAPCSFGDYAEDSSPSSNGTPSWPNDDLTPASDDAQPCMPPKSTSWKIESSSQDEDDADSNRWLEIIPAIPGSTANFAVSKRRKASSSSAPSTHNNLGLHSLMGRDRAQCLNIKEFSLYEETSQSFIISGLRQIYDNSLENGMSLWGVEDNCPFEKKSLWFKRSAISEHSDSLAPKSLFQRANSLDKALAPLRDRELTTVEEAGAARTLKLAIMAFASRWSNEPGDNSKLYGVFSADDSEFEELNQQGKKRESRDFELLMQQSLYAAAMASLERWSYLDSFRVILAGLLVFFIKRPPDEKEVAEVQNMWQSETSPSVTPETRQTASPPDSTGATLNSAPSPPREETGHRFTTSESFRRLMKSDTRKNFLGMALRHLLAWSPKVRAFLKNLPKHSTARHVEADFNILFWLGVMCDTASSSLDHRDLTISDEEADIQLADQDLLDELDELNLSNSKNSPKPEVKEEETFPRLWGNLLMPVSQPCEDPFLYQGSELADRAERILREGSPMKILLLRKICHLQQLMRDHASSFAIERTINETLQVCTYWNTRFTDFFSKCLANYDQLPWRIRTWFVMLLGHWNLGYLHVANCIEQCDQSLTAKTVQAQLRRSSSLSLSLQKEGAYAIAEIARVANKDILTNNLSNTTPINIHSTCRDSSMLTDPCGDLMFLSLSSACDTFLAWSQTLQLPPVPDDPSNLWLHRNVSVGELLVHYTSCIEALKIFGRQYDVATLTAKFYREQIKLIGVGSLREHRKYLRRRIS